jgi:DtxR family Mn-dependent transcriptional regulator
MGNDCGPDLDGSGAAVSDLIDTTEMYLRTIFELEEEGVVPLRARIAERLGQSGPTVSQTVARMQRDGLLTVEGDRHLQLTEAGRAHATRVMRKHRLAECLLVEVIGLEWEDVHAEACRWEHVMSEAVERRLVDLLGHPTESPYGNPIPGLDELGEAGRVDKFLDGLETLEKVATEDGVSVVVRRIGEPAQTDLAVMHSMRRAGVRPGESVVARSSHGGVLVGRGGETVELDPEIASHVFVEVMSPLTR